MEICHLEKKIKIYFITFLLRKIENTTYMIWDKHLSFFLINIILWFGYYLTYN